MKFNKKLIFLLLTVLALSCSRKEDPIVTSDSFSILLKSDAGTDEILVVGLNTAVVFTVEGSDGQNYTNEAQIFVDNNLIEGNTYIFENVGQFTAKAVYNGKTSNELSFEVLEPTARVLTIDVPKALRNQTVTFGLKNDRGEDTADEATFYVNGNAITGKTFSSPTPNAFEVYATYVVNDETYTTEPLPFEVFIPKRKVVVEDYTGTWCGFCPAVALAVEELRAVTNDVAIVAIHKSSSSIPDPLNFPRIADLQAMFNVDNGFPKAQINRTSPWPKPYHLNLVTTMAGKNTDVSIAVSSRLNGNDLTVKVDVVYENGSVSGDKVVVYLLENGVVSPQANYYNETPGHPYQGLGNPIPNYVHNDGLRNALSDLFGDPIRQMPAFDVFSKSYDFTIPTNYVGENLSFVVMVVDADNNAKNAQFAKINERKAFE